jgi:hypothetical protein
MIGLRSCWVQVSALLGASWVTRATPPGTRGLAGPEARTIRPRSEHPRRRQCPTGAIDPVADTGVTPPGDLRTPTRDGEPEACDTGVHETADMTACRPAGQP